jgi:SPP1 family predicted phage head-tail adaptor
VTFDDELVLIDKSYTKDEIGNMIDTEVKTSILCGVKSVSRAEHYAAATVDLQAEIIFVVNKYEYGNQKEVEHSQMRYKVIRSYIPDKAKTFADFESLELVCQGVI